MLSLVSVPMIKTVHLRHFFLLLMLTFFTANLNAAVGAIYEVGPGRTHASLGSVPWLTLSEGDTVRIHWREEPYREKIGLRSRGTEANPIRIVGVPHASGDLPVIDAQNATTDSQFSGFFSPQWDEHLGAVIIKRGPNDSWGYKPGNIIIENLKFVGAHSSSAYTGASGLFTNAEGQPAQYSDGAAAIWAVLVENLTIRGCEITDNGNGIFVLSKNNDEAETSRNVLIEKNYIYANGNEGIDRQHNIYTQVAGITFQYNRIERLRAGSLGSSFKDRSSGMVFRYNWIESSQRTLDLVEAENSYTILMNEPDYNDSYVYGNIILNDTQHGSPFSTNMIHFGGDTGVAEIYRNGTLYFYNNTVVINADLDQAWRVRLFDFENNTALVELRNNIIYRNGTSNFFLMEQYGSANFEGANWISGDWQEAQRTGGGGVNTNGTLLTGTVPEFANALTHDYTLSDNSNAIDSALPLPNGYELQSMYKPHADEAPREVEGSASDLGAFEYSSAAVNNAPVLVPILDIIVNEGEVIEFNPTANDSDGDVLTFTYTGWMTSSSYTTSVGDAGAHTVTVTVSDSKESVSQDVRVTVNEMNSDGFLPAFPGAEGFGAKAIGGRGGKVVKVTNLNDSGPGSFRAAVTSPPRHWVNPNLYVYEPEEDFIQRLDDSGHRIIVFEVSGIINLESELYINTPYLTIAGETSPGGILVTGYQTSIINHDVIMRHMRFRVGSHRIADGANPEQLDSFDVLGRYWGGINADNIIIDHCSFGWGVDETVTFSGGVTNTTIQWSIIAEGLSHAGHPKGEHSKGFLVSGKYQYPNTVTVHHNYIAHNRARNPMIASPADVDTRVDVVNNVVYNWYGGLAPTSAGAAKVNWDNNYAKQGNDSNSYSYEVILGDINVEPNPQLYVHGNVGSTRLSQSDPDWHVGFEWRNQPLDEAWRRLTRWDTPKINTSEMSLSVANNILAQVGATAPIRDAVDSRVITDFAAKTGSIRDNVVFPDDFPTYANLTPPADRDNDGMADLWETENGLNISVDDSALDKNGNGYTNIEEYLHHLSAKNQRPSSDNSPPVLDPIANITVNEGATVVFNPAATDSDGDQLSFSYAGWMNTSRYTTNYSDAGTYSVTVTVSDGTLTDNQVVTITVNNVDLDTDKDGLPDDYERKYAFLNLSDPTDAILDGDGDGLSNLDEYKLNTNPALKDTDRDGLLDKYELDNALDPLDSSDCPAWICRSSGHGWRYVLPNTPPVPAD